MKYYILIFLFVASTACAQDHRILGLGAPCLDYIIKVSDDELAQCSLEKRGWHEIDALALAMIIGSGQSPLVFSGSCVANTVKGLASLGLPCALTGNVGMDPMGDQIRSIFHEVGVTTFFTETTTPTSQIACLITPDGERSFCAFIQAEREISETDLMPEYFEKIDLVHLSGYRLPNGIYTERGLSLAKESGALVSFDLANTHLTAQYRERLLAILSAYVDIVFANEEEAEALTHLSPQKAAAFLKNFCQIAVVKTGADGCWVCSDEGLFHTPGIETTVVDTTGAGDLFASGFLYALLEGEPLERCALLGNMAGSATVERYGAELSPTRWSEILSIFAQNNPNP